MLDVLTLSNTLGALVPITRFNRGEANKIFEEVRESGCKVVVKNNIPACVMLAPEMYQKMVDMIIDQYLLELALEREENSSGITYTAEELLEEDGLTMADIDAMEDVEIE